MNLQPLPLLPEEARIVWLRPANALPPYVREVWVSTGRRRGSVCVNRRRNVHALAVVGYAELRHDAPGEAPRRFLRRAFCLAPHDRENEPNGVYRLATPCEAVLLSQVRHIKKEAAFLAPTGGTA